MNLKELEYYRMVCKHKSITKAAHALYMTPQGLSKIIKNMENELGATLLNRTAAGGTVGRPEIVLRYQGTHMLVCMSGCILIRQAGWHRRSLFGRLAPVPAV